MNPIECFKIRLLKIKDFSIPFDVERGETVLEIPCLQHKYSLNPTIINADPFLFVKNDKFYLFYEEKGLLTDGVLKMMWTKDLKNWSDPVVVLKEKYHLSFPYVFEDNGKVYMIPESALDNSIRLYEATNEDLTEFKFVKKLVVAPDDKKITMGYGDSCICRKDGLYYLFTQICYEDGINTMELYVSDTLDGEYHLHPCSPIQHNMKTGRNAGSIMEIDGKLYRFAQDCTVRYGDNLNINEIKSLTPDNYKEELIQDNVYPSLDFYICGGHQLNAVQFNGDWIVATDAKEYHKNLFYTVTRRLYRLFKR